MLGPAREYLIRQRHHGQHQMEYTGYHQPILQDQLADTGPNKMAGTYWERPMRPLCRRQDILR